ncbi:MAG: carnitine operon protein CaiE [Thalassobaculales bacterium]
MPTVYQIDGITPVVHPGAFVHPSAVLIGDVIIEDGAYVAPLAALRGDFGRILVGRGANVQDCCVMHCFPGADCVIEEDGHIGHGVVLHGCRVARGALVGMNSVVMDGAVIGEQAFVAAMSFVKSGFAVPPRTLVAGVPAKVVRDLSQDEMDWKQLGTLDYQDLVRRSHASLRAVEALPAIEPGRPRFSTGRALPKRR